MNLTDALECWRSASELAWEAERSVEAAVAAALQGRATGVSPNLLESAQTLRAQADQAFETLAKSTMPSVPSCDEPRLDCPSSPQIAAGGPTTD